MTDEATTLYIEGIQAFGRGEHDVAVERYHASLAVRPDDTEVLNALSMALMGLERFEEAVEIGNKVVELDPDDPMIHTSLSMIYQRMGKIEEAEAEAAKHRMKSWKQELKANPNAPPPEDGDFKVIQ